MRWWSATSRRSSSPATRRRRSRSGDLRRRLRPAGPGRDPARRGRPPSLTTRNRRVGVIATPATIRSHAYFTAIKDENPAVEVYEHATPSPRSDGRGRAILMRHEIEAVVADALAPLLGERDAAGEFIFPLPGSARIDTLLLGCTHYPLLRSTIASIAGDRIAIVDSATATASALARAPRDQRARGTRHDAWHRRRCRPRRARSPRSAQRVGHPSSSSRPATSERSGHRPPDVRGRVRRRRGHRARRRSCLGVGRMIRREPAVQSADGPQVVVAARARAPGGGRRTGVGRPDSWSVRPSGSRPRCSVAGPSGPPSAA